MNWVGLTAVVLVLAANGVALACPMCKDSIPGSDAAEAGSLPGGFNTSVYLMLLGFFGTLGLIIKTVVSGIRGTNVANPGFPVMPRRPHDDPQDRSDPTKRN